jgi:hypothetical protein
MRRLDFRPTNSWGLPVRPPKTSAKLIQLAAISAPSRPVADLEEPSEISPIEVDHIEIGPKSEVAQLLERSEPLLYEMDR